MAQLRQWVLMNISRVTPSCCDVTSHDRCIDPLPSKQTSWLELLFFRCFLQSAVQSPPRSQYLPLTPAALNKQHQAWRHGFDWADVSKCIDDVAHRKNSWSNFFMSDALMARMAAVKASNEENNNSIKMAVPVLLWSSADGTRVLTSVLQKTCFSREKYYWIIKILFKTISS